MMNIVTDPSSFYGDFSFPDLLAWKGLIIAGWFASLFLLERLFPAALRPLVSYFQSRHRLISNLGLWIINIVLSPLIIIPLTAFAVSWAGDGSLVGWLGFDRAALSSWAMPSLSVLLVDLIVLDFFIYWWHRANHSFSFLWRFHEIHHLDRWLDTTTAVRFHFMEVLLSAGFRVAIILSFGISLFSVVVFEVLILVASLFHHSNIRLLSGLEKVLSYLMVTPSIHWVHHHAVKSDTDSNYATVFSFWDRLFKSFSPHARDLEMTIGLQAPQPQGKTGKDDALPDALLGGLLLRPFRLKKG